MRAGSSMGARSASCALTVGLILGLQIASGALSAAHALFPYPTTPNWQSTPSGYVSTGCALRDLNGDGYPDLIVANGNDMARQPLVVYLNQHGAFPLNPTWISSDVDYQGHLDLADVDGDGNLDCAVAVYLGAGGFGAPGHVKLYHGNGDGTFSATPVWTSQDSFYCFSVSFGDVDMDGRPDLACATGESYNRFKEHLRVYRNTGGALGSLPYWQSSGLRYALDVTWGDVNGDGRLDAAFACESNPSVQDPTTYPSEIYFGNGTTLDADPGWVCQDGHDYSNTIALGDLNGDGWLDVAIADNNQIHGGNDYGRIKVFLNQGSGTFPAQPTWISGWNGNGYGSHVSLIDADNDGDLDLAAGWWWGPVALYANQDGVLPANPTWQSATGSVVENVAWEDVDNDGLQSSLIANFYGNGGQKLFVLPRRPVRVQRMLVGGVPLDRTQFLASADQGWLTLASAPLPGVLVSVFYAASVDLDFAVSNWDSNIGNYLFLNYSNPALVTASEPDGKGTFALVPNPAPGACRIVMGPRATAATRVEIFAASGERIRMLNGAPPAGTAAVYWDGKDALGKAAAAGSYWVRLSDGGRVSSQRLVLIR